MTTSEAATERAITFSIKIGYWNVGLQESIIECDARENHLRKLRDVAELWVKHELHALCLCEVGSHSTGFHNEHNHKVVEERICGYIRELHKEWVNTKRIRKRQVEPALRTYWNNNYMMVCDEQCLRVEHVPKAVYIRPDEYHHYTAVVLRSFVNSPRRGSSCRMMPASTMVSNNVNTSISLGGATEPTADEVTQSVWMMSGVTLTASTDLEEPSSVQSKEKTGGY